MGIFFAEHFNSITKLESYEDICESDFARCAILRVAVISDYRKLRFTAFLFFTALRRHHSGNSHTQMLADLRQDCLELGNLRTKFGVRGISFCVGDLLDGATQDFP